MRKMFLILSLFAVLLLSGQSIRAENYPQIRPPEAVETTPAEDLTSLFNFGDRKKESTANIPQDPLWTPILDLINKNYVDENPDKQKMLEGAINGMLKALDPHSAYHNPEQYKKLTEEMSGEFEGIGARLEMAGKSIIVIGVFDGSSAQKAGLKAGDIIVKVKDSEGEIKTSGESLEIVVKKIRGKKETKVVLTVVRKGAPKPIQIEMTRNTVAIVSAEAEKIGDIGYVKLNVFGDKSLSETKTALEKMKKQGAQKLIIDLRGNGGGRLDMALDIASLFLPKNKTIVSIKERVKTITYLSDGGGFTDTPLVILTNAYSASASEILAAAIKENGRGKIVGTTTYGKGSVQSVISLSNGGALRLTIAKFYSPNGNEIHGKGVAPDVEVEIKDEENFKIGDAEKDPQLRKAMEILDK